MAFSFTSRGDVLVIISLTLIAILIELINCDRFHPSQNNRPTNEDPIDPTGGNNPGIVIVYKKSGDRDLAHNGPSSSGSYLPSSSYNDRNTQSGNYNSHNSHSSSSSSSSRDQNYPPPPQQSSHRQNDYPPPHQIYTHRLNHDSGTGPYQSEKFELHPKKNNRGKIPKCAGSDDQYCLLDRDYPMDKINSIAQNYGNRLSSLYEELNHYTMQDYMSHDNVTHNYREKGHFICESDVSYVRPGWAKNWKGEWVAVLNTDVMPQSVRIETCKYPKKKCEYMPPCYKSYCVQRYTYVKLITLDPDNPDKKPTVDVFEIPSACSCFVENFAFY